MILKWKMLWIYCLSIIVGLFTGFFGSIFQLGIAWLAPAKFHVSSWVAQIGIPEWFTLGLFSGLSAVLAAYLVYRFAPEASGSGVQEIEGALLGKRPMKWRALLPVKFFGGLSALSAGMVLGREGPTIQMGGHFGEAIGEKCKLDREKRNILIGAGAGAGLATAFNAPLAGIVFVLEEMREQFKYSFVSITAVAFACIIATVVLRLFMGQGAEIIMKIYHHPPLYTLLLFLVFGIVIGVIGLLFNLALVGLLDNLVLLRHHQRFLYALIVGAAVGMLCYYFPAVVGGGYKIMGQAMTMHMSTYMLIFLVIARFIATVLCYSTGVPGGIFAPMLAIGTLSGLAFGQICIAFFPDIGVSPGMFAVAGMGALFAASVRAPMTGIILIVEMTQNYYLILPCMLACLTATIVVQVANNPPLYEQLLERTLEHAAKFKKAARAES